LIFYFYFYFFSFYSFEEILLTEQPYWHFGLPLKIMNSLVGTQPLRAFVANKVFFVT